MALFKWDITDEKPKASRAGSQEVSEDRQEILDAFRASIKNGTVTHDEKVIGASIALVVPDSEGFKGLRRLVQWAAAQEEMGSRIRLDDGFEGQGLRVIFWAVSLEEKLYAECPECHANVAVTEKDTLRTHGPRENRCSGSGLDVEVSQA